MLANLVNWFLNWVLIYGKFGMPAMGVNGSAVSTVLRTHYDGGCADGFRVALRAQPRASAFKHWAGPQVARLKQLLKLGAPAAGQILLEVGAWNLATFSAGYLTPVALATHQIVLNYASVTYMVPLGISAAAAVSVAHAVGAGDAARARRAGWLALGLGTGFMLLAASTFVVFPTPLIELYTSDPRVLAIGPALLGSGGLSNLRRHPDCVDRVVTRAGRNASAHACKFGRLLGAWTTARLFPLLRPEVGDLWLVDRAHGGAGDYSDGTPVRWQRDAACISVTG